VVPQSGHIKGKWVAYRKRNRMSLKLNLSLDGLGLQDLSLSVLDQISPGSPPSHPMTGPVPPIRSTVAEPDPSDREKLDRWEAETNSSQSIMTFGSCPSTAPPLSDLPLTPIPELLHTPTPPKKTTPVSNILPRAHPPHHITNAHSVEQQQQHLTSNKIPSPLDSGPILAQLAQGENEIGSIKNVRFLPSIHGQW